MPEAVSVEQVQPGDHACLTFSDPHERLDLLAAFVRDGLRSQQKVLCWTASVDPERLRTELADRSVRAGAALRRGQLRLATVPESLGADAAANARAMLKILADEVSQAGREGFPALRVTADMCWATGSLSAPETLMAFESEAAELLADGRLCVICEYDRDRFDAVTLAFAAKTHPKTVAALAYHDHPLLRVCRQYSPPGLRVAGELDFRHLDVLNQALAESLRLDRRVHVNLAGLQYIDGACASALVRAARTLPASRRMIITCRRLVRTVLDLVGAGAVAQLHFRHVDDQSS